MPAARLRNPLSVLSAFTSIPADSRFRHLAEQLDQAVFLVNPRSGEILDTNTKAVEFTGYSRDELTQLPLSRLIPADETIRPLAEMRTLTLGTSRELISVPFLTHSGAVATADLRISDVSQEGEQSLVLLLARDAEHRLAIEEASSRRGTSLSALEQLATLLLYPGEKPFDRAIGLYRDFLAADTVGTYRPTESIPTIFELWRANPTDTKLPARMEQTDLPAGSDPVVWHDAGQKPQSPLAQAARDSGFSALLTYHIGPSDAPHGILVACFRAGNAAIDMAPSQTAVAASHLTALIHMIARDKRAEHWKLQARNSELSLDTVLAKMIECAIGVDPEGCITRVNPAAEQLLGFHEKEMVEKQLEDLLHPRPVASAVLQALRQGVLYSSDDVELTKRPGDDVHVSLTAVPVDNSVGEPAGGLILLRDRTERRALEEKARHLERRAWLGDMSASFAHKVNNPLNGITLALGLLKQEIASDDPLQDSLNDIYNEARRIEDFAKNTLLIVNPSELQIMPTDMGTFMKSLKARWQGRMQRNNIACELTVAPDTPPALADANQIEEVFSNLLNNAMQAIGNRGGVISLTVQPAPLSSSPKGDYVQVNVGDDGPGIQPEDQERIFDLFFTRKKRKGTGLGLATARQIVKAHEGTLNFQSWPSVGTVFSVVLPQATDHPYNDSKRNNGIDK